MYPHYPIDRCDSLGDRYTVTYVACQVKSWMGTGPSTIDRTRIRNSRGTLDPLSGPRYSVFQFATRALLLEDPAPWVGGERDIIIVPRRRVLWGLLHLKRKFNFRLYIDWAQRVVLFSLGARGVLIYRGCFVCGIGIKCKLHTVEYSNR